ncbi:unnamed protein product [Arabidopsis halleri]
MSSVSTTVLTQVAQNCCRYWTDGGALRNVPISGSYHKTKRARIDQPSVCLMVSVEIQPGNHQPFLHVQDNIAFVGSFGALSSSFDVFVV